MQHWGHIVLGLIFVALAGPSSASADKRVALVVGNSAYEHTGRLANPRNDATDVSAALKSYGFHVIDGLDLNKASFDRILRDFATASEGAAAGVFFYAGHGLQVDGVNYLIPVDAQLNTGAALEFEMVRLDLVQRVMERQTTTNVLFLDACRDNPLARNLARSMGTRSSAIGTGLASVEGGVGTLISFSTQPGNVASDGTGRNSPYAGALVRQLQSGGEELSAILIGVRNDVIKETQRKQVPWEHSALTGKFFFRPPKPAAPSTTGEHPFDGIWASEYSSNTCTIKSGTYTILIQRSEVTGYGGVVSRDGDASFATAGRANPNVRVHHRIKLAGDTGTGEYGVPGSSCVGTEVLKRVGPAPAGR